MRNIIWIIKTMKAVVQQSSLKRRRNVETYIFVSCAEAVRYLHQLGLSSLRVFENLKWVVIHVITWI